MSLKRAGVSNKISPNFMQRHLLSSLEGDVRSELEPLCLAKLHQGILQIPVYLVVFLHQRNDIGLLGSRCLHGINQVAHEGERISERLLPPLADFTRVSIDSTSGVARGEDSASPIGAYMGPLHSVLT